MLTALVHDAQGHRSTAVDCLSAAFTTASESGAYALVPAEGEPMLTLLRHAQHRSAADGHPACILTQYERPAPNPARRPVERAGDAGATTARQRPHWPRDRAHTVRLLQHRSHAHSPHLRQAPGDHPPVSSPSRRRTSAAVTPAPSSISPSRSHRWMRWRHPARHTFRFSHRTRRTRRACQSPSLPARSRRQLHRPRAGVTRCAP